MGICFDVHWGAHSFAIKGEIHVDPTIQREGCVVVVSRGLIRPLQVSLAELSDSCHLFEQDTTHYSDIGTTVCNTIGGDPLNL